MRYYAVIDTNVLVSALLSSVKVQESNPLKVVRYVFGGRVRPVFNDTIINEYRDVLNRKKFRFDPTLVEIVIEELVRIGISSKTIETDENFPDPDDAVFFEVAMAYEQVEPNTFLITGNLKHFSEHPIVITPADFVKLLEKNE